MHFFRNADVQCINCYAEVTLFNSDEGTRGTDQIHYFSLRADTPGTGRQLRSGLGC